MPHGMAFGGAHVAGRKSGGAPGNRTLTGLLAKQSCVPTRTPFGAQSRNRTHNRLFTKQQLCQLSYPGEFGGGWRSRTPNLSDTLVFGTSCQPTQRHPPIWRREWELNPRSRHRLSPLSKRAHYRSAIPPKFEDRLDDMMVSNTKKPRPVRVGAWKFCGVLS